MNKRALIFAIIGVLLLMTVTRKVWALPAKGVPYLTLLSNAEYQYGLPSRLLARLAQQESNFDPNAINQSSGASGIVQIVPKWHPGVDPFNPSEAIPYAAKYLRENYNQFGSWAKSLAAYNWGPGNLSKVVNKPNWLTFAPTETRNYVTGILGDLGLPIV